MSARISSFDTGAHFSRSRRCGNVRKRSCLRSCGKRCLRAVGKPAAFPSGRECLFSIGGAAVFRIFIVRLSHDQAVDGEGQNRLLEKFLDGLGSRHWRHLHSCLHYTGKI